MLLSEKVSYRFKRIYLGIAIGVAVCLLYASFLILSNIGGGPSVSGVELVLTPVKPVQK